ncbi:MAG TPA: M24 family metallopeptidase, partial [Steroidobacteraceae bacterium]
MSTSRHRMLRTTQISLKSPEEQQKLRVAGALAADVLDMIGDHIAAGTSTDELDRICHDYIVNVQQAVPANVGYRGFPKTVCTSVNHVVCHGIPNERRLKSGDIVNIDVAIIKDGYHGDTSRMYFVGKPPVLGQRLAQVCKDAMWRAIELVRPGAHLGDIGHAIQSLAEA